MNGYTLDYPDDNSDPELVEAIETSRREYEAQQQHRNSTMIGESSRIHVNNFQQQLSQLDAEISKCDEEIAKQKACRKALVEERERIQTEFDSVRLASYPTRKGKGKETGIDYSSDGFDWIGGLKARMKEVFGIESFRLCQQGVCNASMDGRDIVCVMPTGGGKSLTYQLPALLSSGVTLVISPLISLISDQIMHLKDAGVEAVKLTGSTSKADSNEINRRLNLMASGRAESVDKEIKLLYVTPEKIARNKSFTSLLQRLANASKLARIVIDEAHCVSQLGHDFRPDYQKLHILRQLFPQVPIMALSATCPPLVLQDLLNILRLKGVVDGRNASTQGTVYFSAPLYRKNLHYKVLPKAGEGNRVLDDITDYILKNHKNDTGIIYCLSKKDTEKVAQELQTRGGIRTGVYHADRTDTEKEGLHRLWRNGQVKVVCATIAFGLGIDKGDVRFVIHHSISKSLDGFYQESGRAGRDGKDSDCVLFYRAQDAATLSSMAYSEKDGNAKLYAMLNFAQDLGECRKLLFAKYFSHSSQLSMSSWSTDEAGALDKCGHCDNCTREPGTVERKDVTIEAWKVIKVVEEVVRVGGAVTLPMLGALARGGGAGGFNVNASGGSGVGKGSKGKGKGKEKMNIDLDEVCGGKVELKRDDIETLIVHLLLQKYLKEKYHHTSYSTVVYLIPGPLAPRLSSHSHEAVNSGLTRVPRIECEFRVVSKKSAGTRTTGKEGDRNVQKETNDIGSRSASREAPTLSTSKQRKRARAREPKQPHQAIHDEEEGESFDFDDIMEFQSDIDEQQDEDDGLLRSSPPPRPQPRPRPPPAAQAPAVTTHKITNSGRRKSTGPAVVDADEWDEEDEWSFGFRPGTSSMNAPPSAPPTKKRKIETGTKSTIIGDVDVVELTSDSD